jgi:hypothetical protein
MEFDMQMTHTIKALAAAVTMTFALGAQAAPINLDQIGNLGAGTGVGNLVLAMYDAGNARSAVFNTQITANGFNAQAGNSFNVNIAAADLNSLNGFLGGVTNLSQFRWNIVAGVNVIENLETEPTWDSFGFQSTAAPGTAITTANGPNSVDPAIFGAHSAISVFFSAQNALTGNPLATGNVGITNGVTSTSAFLQSWRNNLDGAGAFNNTGMLGESLGYFFYGGLGTDPGLGQVASTKYAGEWKLDYSVAAGTTLSYNVAPIPVPAAVWMLGSGIAGLIATRRRKAA